jgi:ribosomal protein S18 acetylase RimI-like enzyme
MGVEILKFDRIFAKAFADLNYEWIASAYGIEEHDREILDHPESYIVDRGGQMFFAVSDGVAVGTVAMIKIDVASYELAKMAVSPDQRRQGISNKLMEACIGFAIENEAKKIILESNTKQAAAIKLYRKYGFAETELDPNSPYVRANIRMELAIGEFSM